MIWLRAGFAVTILPQFITLTTRLTCTRGSCGSIIKELINASLDLSHKAQKLTAITGVGERTAVLLLAQMPELGELNRREAAAEDRAFEEAFAEALGG